MKKILFSPVTHFNLLFVGLLIFIGVLHNSYHSDVEKDVHGYVRNFCSDYPDKCRDYLKKDEY